MHAENAPAAALFLVGCLAGCSSTPAGPSDAGAAPDTGMVGATSGALVDTDTGEAWSLTGVAEGTQDALVSITGYNAFWFAWSTFHPGERVYGDTDPITGAVPTGEAECTVPCAQISPACSGRDCIPALTSPSMVPVGDASLSYLRDEDRVMGVLTSEGPRAYPENILNWHEIINEDVGGDAYTVTLCPLTGSAIRYDRRGFVDGAVVELGVSGNLYNSNLVMYDRTSDSWWSQMRLESVFGSELGQPAPIQPIFEMSYIAWRTLHPDTLVVSDDTGHSRDYTLYPYGDYRSNQSNTFRDTDPPPDPRFLNKDMVFGVDIAGVTAAYAWSDLEASAGARRGVLEDEVDGVPVAIVFDLDALFVHAYDRRAMGGAARTLAIRAE